MNCCAFTELLDLYFSLCQIGKLFFSISLIAYFPQQLAIIEMHNSRQNRSSHTLAYHHPNNIKISLQSN